MYVVTHPVSADWLLRGQLGFMRRHGFDVSVVAAPGDLLARVEQREGASTFAVPMARSASEPHRDLAAVARLVRVLRRVRPDIVNASTPKGGLVGMLAARIVDTPVRVYLLRGLRLETVTGPLRSVLGITERVAASCAHDVACVSQSLLDVSVAGGFIPRAKSLVVGAGSSNGVDTAHFGWTEALRADGERRMAALGIAPTDPVIGFVGRLVFDKGVVEALDAFARVRAELPTTKLVFLGSHLGDQSIDPALVRKVRAAEGVVFTGHIPDVAPFYARMNVLAFPSYREGLSNTLLEAACAELPVVAFRSTGIVDSVTDGETGTLVDPFDSAGLARGLLTYLRSPDLARAHAKAARIRVEHSFSRRAVWDAWLDFYRGRLAKRGLPLPVAEPGAEHPDGPAAPLTIS